MNNKLKNENKTFKFIVKPLDKHYEGYCYYGGNCREHCGGYCEHHKPHKWK